MATASQIATRKRRRLDRKRTLTENAGARAAAIARKEIEDPAARVVRLNAERLASRRFAHLSGVERNRAMKGDMEMITRDPRPMRAGPRRVKVRLETPASLLPLMWFFGMKRAKSALRSKTTASMTTTTR